MKRTILSLVAVTLLCLTVTAIPADPRPVTVPQPDGTSVTLVLHGDEFFHYTTTTDGYTVLGNQDTGYRYAQREGDRLVSSTLLVHEVGQRSADELRLLANTPVNLRDETALERGRQSQSNRVKRRLETGLYDYDNFRGLIILVQYNDCAFEMPDPVAFYNDQVNKKNYTGYTDTWSDQSGNEHWVSCTGSVRDYYYDNSMGQFDPEFDIYGPVTVNFSQYYPSGSSKAWEVFIAAIDAIDDEVDFSQYDTDGDGMVDMVYFIVAGMSANFSGNDQNLLWPYMSYLFDFNNFQWFNRDGVDFGRYACSCEIYGWSAAPQTLTTHGIGTMCHEFGHVLGLPDLYDTDYDGSGGRSHDPGAWNIMAGGGSFNSARTPCGYTIYERYALGFAMPQEITSAGHYSLNPINTSNEGFVLRTDVENEFFLMDNRNRTRWDAYIPGNGMIIARVDSTNVDVWQRNEVNCSPSHNYFELLRAGNSSADDASDPFPGSDDVTMVTNFTTPSLKTYDEVPSRLVLNNIKRSSDGVVSFDVEEAEPIKEVVEDFETMPVDVADAQDVAGRFAHWNFVKAAVVEPGEEQCSGARAVAMKQPSAFSTVTPTCYDAYQVMLDVVNPTSTQAKLRLEYNLDGGTSWTTIKAESGTTANVAAKSSETLKWRVNFTNDQTVYYRVMLTSGNTSKEIYVDNFTIRYTGTPGIGPAEPVFGDVNGDRIVDVEDLSEIIDVVLGRLSKDDLIGNPDLDDNGSVDVKDVSLLIDLIIKGSAASS